MTDYGDRAASRTRRVVYWVSVLVSAATAGLLVATALAGSNVRPIADDWCIAAWTQNEGVFGIVDRFYFEVNGRGANAVINAIVYSFGLAGPKVLPALIVVGYVVGLFLALRLGGRVTRIVIPRSVAVAVSTTVTVLVLMSGRVVYQVYYWAPGSVSHTLPPLIAIWVFVLVAWSQSSRHRAVRIATLALVALGGFIIGSLSEAFVLVSGVYASAGLLVLLRMRASWRWWGHPVTWLAGLFVGFALLFFSPGRRGRQSRSLDQAPLSEWEGVRDLLHQWVSIWEVLLTEPVHVAAVAVGLIAGLSTTVHRARCGPRTVGAVAAVLLLLAAVSSLGVALALRVGYGQNGWRYERVWINFVVSALLTAVVLSAMVGAWLRQVLSGAGAVILAVTAGVVVIGSVASVVPEMTSLNQEMAARAVVWDQQHTRLQRLASQGRGVVAYTPSPLAGMTEPFTYRVYDADWVAHCVEEYYGVDRLRPSKEWLRGDDSAAYRGVAVP